MFVTDLRDPGFPILDMVETGIQFEFNACVARIICKCFWIKTGDFVNQAAILFFVDREGSPGRTWTHATLRAAGFENLVEDMKWWKYSAGAKIRNIVYEGGQFRPSFFGITMKFMPLVFYDSHKLTIR